MRYRPYLLLLLLFPATLWGQENCTPKPLPYIEDFNTGFIHDNGWYTSMGDYTYQEQDNCWTVCWVHAWGWRSLLGMFGSQSRKAMLLRANKYNHGGTKKQYEYAVSPRMAEAPRRLQLQVAYRASIWTSPVTIVHLTHGAWLALGYVTDEDDCINTYVPFDTLRVFADWVEEDTMQSFDIDLGRYFDTFPQPWRIAFRPEKSDESDDILIMVDDIRISDEVPEYHCTEDYADTICQGTGYYRHGFHIPPERTNDLGTRYYSYVDTTGCLVSLDLTVTGNHTIVLVDTVPCGQPSRYAPDTVLPSGTHYFYLTDPHGCDSLVVLTIVQAWVTHLYDTIMKGDTLLFEGRTLTSSGTYTHDTVASDGCDSLVVLHLRCLPLPTVNTDTLVFWFPNVFSPELEGNNRFGCVTNAQVTEFEMYIYHRWGQRVYSTNDISDWWDGGGLPQGAYVYYYRLRTAADNRVYTGKGTVTLLR